MNTKYQTPEAVEVGKAESIIFGEKPGDSFDQATMSFVRTLPTAVDVDE